MRKLPILMLLASVAAAPAFGARPPSDKPAAAPQHQPRTEHEARPQRPARSEAAPRSQPANSAPTGGGAVRAPATATVRIIRPSEAEPATPQQPARDRAGKAAVPPRAVELPKPVVRERIKQRPEPAVRPQPPVVSPVPKAGTQPPPKTESRPTARPQWNGDWRNSNRYDWRNWRKHHRHRFHLHFYFDPFGWGYYRYWIGWRLWPGYYGSRYWIMDPWYYRLPPAPPGTRWVRYYNDALLVDMWSGEVIDVIHDFFW